MFGRYLDLGTRVTRGVSQVPARGVSQVPTRGVSQVPTRGVSQVPARGVGRLWSSLQAGQAGVASRHGLAAAPVPGRRTMRCCTIRGQPRPSGLLSSIIGTLAISGNRNRRVTVTPCSGIGQGWENIFLSGAGKINDVTQCFNRKCRGSLGPRYFQLKHKVTSLNSIPGQEVH